MKVIKSKMCWAVTISLFIFLLFFHTTTHCRDVVLFDKALHDSTIFESYCIPIHDVGKLAVKSRSSIFFGGRTSKTENCLTNKRTFLYGAEYPKNSGIASLNTAGIYIGGILDNDTLFIRGGRQFPLVNSIDQP